MTLTDYLHTPRPTLNWLIQGLIPSPGIILLQGPPKEGKSFVAFDIARAIARGEPYMGRSVAQTRTLYLQFDTSELVWRDRIANIQANGIPIDGPFMMVHPEDMQIPLNILTPAGRNWLAQTVRESGAGFVVIDVLREIHTGDENDSTEMKQVGDILTAIFHDRALLLVHHSRKLNPEFGNVDPASASRGSSYITGKVDAIWLLWQGKLDIQPRFAERRKIPGTRLDCGIMRFSDELSSDDLTAEILGLCVEFPHISHNALFPLAEQKWNVSRATYYRILGNQVCAHTNKGTG